VTAIGVFGTRKDLESLLKKFERDGYLYGVKLDGLLHKPFKLDGLCNKLFKMRLLGLCRDTCKFGHKML